MNAYWDRIREQLPTPGTVGDLLDAVQQLPGLEQWEPADGSQLMWPEIVHWGLVFKLTSPIADADQLRREVAKGIIAEGKPDSAKFAELSAAALCTTFEATWARKLPREINRKTADWRMRWPVDAEVDLEATMALEKPKHLELQAIANELAHALFRPQRDFDLVLHLADPSQERDRQAILRAADGIRCGDTVEDVPRWTLRAVPINRGVTVVMPTGVEERPTWWSPDDACRFVLVGQVAGPETVRAPAQVRIGFAVPYASYINLVERKARMPQGEPGLPFLIAVNIGNLPGAFREIPRVASAYLQQWGAVSGILLFHDMVSFDRTGWTWRLISNPHAKLPLPAALTRDRADLPTAMDSYRQL